MKFILRSLVSSFLFLACSLGYLWLNPPTVEEVEEYKAGADYLAKASRSGGRESHFKARVDAAAEASGLETDRSGAR